MSNPYNVSVLDSWKYSPDTVSALIHSLPVTEVRFELPPTQPERDEKLQSIVNVLRNARRASTVLAERKSAAAPEPGLMAMLVVPSTSRGKAGHEISFYENLTAICSCEGFTFRKTCKHIRAIDRADKTLHHLLTGHLVMARQIGELVRQAADA